MPDSNYAKESDPMSAIQVQLTVMSTRLEDVQEGLKEVRTLPSQIIELNSAVKQFNKDHEDTKKSLESTKLKVESLNVTDIEIKALKKFVGICGVATVSVILGSWYALGNKVDGIKDKSELNEQKIIVLEKNQDQLMRIQDDIRMRLYQRESAPPIITTPQQ